MAEIVKLVCSIFLLALLNSIECSESTTKTVQFLYKHSAILDCSKLGENVKFYKKNQTEEPTLLEKQEDHVLIDGKVVTLKDLRKEYINLEYFCTDVSNNKITFVKEILPFLVRPEKASITITKGGFTDQISCKILYGYETDGKWTWTKDDEVIKLSDDEKIKIDSNEYDSKLIIHNVNDLNRGKYNCTYSNKYGNHTESIILRVKDPLAALWPFLAIIAEVVVLCLIILIYEKKCSKKNNEDNENEQAANLLNREGVSSDVKKRTAKN